MITFNNKIYVDNLGSDEVLFDIETTGINKVTNAVFLIGLIDGATGEFKQFFSEDGNDYDVLKSFIEIANGRKLVTYNGRTFDIPFIQSRLKIHGFPKLEYIEDYDLFYSLRKYKRYLGVKRHKLTIIEEMFGIKRIDTLDSSEIPKEYAQFLEGTTDYKELLLHNEQDVLNTEKLLFLRNSIFEARSFNLFFKDICVSGLISNIEFDKDYCHIKTRVRNPFKFPIEFIDANHDVSWHGSKLNIRIRIVECIIDPSVKKDLGNSEKRNLQQIPNLNKSLIAKCYFSTLINMCDKSEYQLPKNLLILEVDRKYTMGNFYSIIETLAYKLTSEQT